MSCEDHGPSRGGHERAPCRTVPLRFLDSCVPPTRHRGLASSKRSADDARERAQEEMLQDDGLRWRTKIGAPPADGCRNWRRVAIRLKAAPLWQVLLAGKAGGLRLLALQLHASHLAHGEIPQRQAWSNQGHIAQHRWPRRIDGATRRSRGLQVPRIPIAGRTPVQDQPRKDNPHLFRN